MIAYKAFEKGLICRGYQFSNTKTNITDKANCVANGFHCAENPLDCLSYYSDFNGSEFYIVNAHGDVDEDDIDSKISCTKLDLIRKLSIEDFVAESLKYLYLHQKRKPHKLIHENEGKANTLFVIVKGANPIASGKLNSVLGFIKMNTDFNIIEKISMIKIDGTRFKEDTFYTIEGEIAFSTGDVND